MPVRSPRGAGGRGAPRGPRGAAGEGQSPHSAGWRCGTPTHSRAGHASCRWAGGPGGPWGSLRKGLLPLQRDAWGWGGASCHLGGGAAAAVCVQDIEPSDTLYPSGSGRGDKAGSGDSGAVAHGASLQTPFRETTSGDPAQGEAAGGSFVQVEMLPRPARGSAEDRRVARNCTVLAAAPRRHPRRQRAPLPSSFLCQGASRFRLAPFPLPPSLSPFSLPPSLSPFSFSPVGPLGFTGVNKRAPGCSWP